MVLIISENRDQSTVDVIDWLKYFSIKFIEIIEDDKGVWLHFDVASSSLFWGHVIPKLGPSTRCANQSSQNEHLISRRYMPPSSTEWSTMLTLSNSPETLTESKIFFNILITFSNLLLGLVHFSCKLLVHFSCKLTRTPHR